MMRSRFLILALLLVAGTSFSPSNPYPQGLFRWPVDHPVRLSGTFGELRSNHFHAGMDIRSSAQRIGDPLYSAAEGYVARIKVEEAGYGRALYIAHPSGYTTLYAHMDRFTEELEGYLKHEQYRTQCFEVDLYPPPYLFTFRQGQYIGNMGNTGASQGPHLHWEIRDTKTDKAFNPLLFGLPLTDKMAPQIYTLKLYQMDGLGVYGSRAKDFDVDPHSDFFHPEPETLVVNTPFAGFAVKAFDQHDSPSNRNGIYSIHMKVDGKEAFQLNINEVPFEDSRYINAHMDYQDQVTSRSYFHRCFHLPGDYLQIYSVAQNHGIVFLQPGETKFVEIRVSDALENESLLRFWVRREGSQAPPAPGPYQYYLYHDRDNLIQTEDCSVFIPGRTIYEDLPMNFRKAKGSGSNYLSEVFYLHDYLTPVHQFFSLSLKAGHTVREADKTKAFVAYLNPRGSVINCGGRWKGDEITASVRQFGPYAILVDKTPPSVSASSFKYDMRGRKSMSFRISDNYSTAPNMDKLYFNASVDGKWILMEYDRKSGLITHRFDQRISEGKHLLRLEVRDVMGNSTVLEKHFIR